MEEMEEAYDLLANSRSRAIIEYFQHHDGAVKVSVLARTIAAEENDVTVDDVSGYQQKIVYNSLVQRQLPRLERQQIIRYNDAQKKIRPTPKTEEVAQYLRIRSAPQHSWEIYYLLAGVFCSFIILASSINFINPALLNGMELNGLIVSVFLIISVFNTYDSWMI
ncbi:DUF7344 domain-containing protein [Haladaptatus caseinilyticus]|uniref:DUF7344 domain-containing protein n=1 Tax=Haladaptatus caseinilyticus TaxID=2993314 RepID=UPI00224B6BC3|nr:hypothetical protein [Haladaptatus caseinilyticus]